MAVIKLNKAGTVLQFIDDEGNIFQQGLGLIKQLMNRNIAHDFVLLTRLPMKASADRFKKSPVWNPVSGKVEESVSDSITNNLRVNTSEDSLSVSTVNDAEQQKMYANNEVRL